MSCLLIVGWLAFRVLVCLVCFFLTFENGRLSAMDCPLIFSHHCLWRRCCRFKAGLHPGRVASLLQGTVAFTPVNNPDN